MPVVVIGKFRADVAKFLGVVQTRAADFEAIAAEAKTKGALHHRFVGGDGEVLIIDEWESAEAFQRFFSSQPVIPQIMQEAGVQGPPEFSFYSSLASPDLF